MPDGSVRVEHVWKRFRADRHAPLFQEHIARLGRRVRGQSPIHYRWALREINLDIEPGHSYGIIGINGSGKSTLLKMICKTTYPTVGRITAQGRIGALLEVRSGIHPDLSGKENINLFGTILGLNRRQIAQRFDAIVDFAEINEAVYRQVKFYSTGMAIRLGFAIAAFLEPDILLVDEVLAVGDARFQQKCLERIGQVVEQGTTLLYVSHDLPTVEAVCERALWLAESRVRADGPARDVVALYRASVEEQASFATSDPDGVRVLKVEITGPGGGQARSGEELNVRMLLNSPKAFQGALNVGISLGTATAVYVVRHTGDFPQGDFEVTCKMAHFPLPKGRYSVWAIMREVANTAVPPPPVLPWQPVASFEAFGPAFVQPPLGVMVPSPLYIESTWDVQ